MELTGAPSLDRSLAFVLPSRATSSASAQIRSASLTWISAPEVFRRSSPGWGSGVKPKDIVAYDRYRSQFLGAGFEKWLPEGVRWRGVLRIYNDRLQLDMDGYDRISSWRWAWVTPPGDPGNSHHRRSYVAKF